MLITVIAALALALTLVLWLRPSSASARPSRDRAPWYGLIALVAAFALGIEFGSSSRYLDALISHWSQQQLPDYVRAFDATGDPARIEPLIASVPSSPWPANDPEESSSWRSRLINELRTSLAFDPASSTGQVDLTVFHEQLLPDGILRQFVSFTSFDGTRIPAFLLHPAGTASSRPAVLVIPGHGKGICGAAGLLTDYQNQSALELTRSGYVSLVPELRGFGLLGPRIGLDHRVVATNTLRAGESYKGVVARDLQLALTALSSVPGVETERIGVAGASLGGDLALLLGVLEDHRVAAIAVNSNGRHVGPLSDAEAIAQFSRRHGCHILPAGAPRLLMEDWYRLLVPRPLLVIDGESDLRGDSGLLPTRVEEFEAALREAYALEGAAAQLTITVAPGGHEFFVQQTIDFFDRHFGE